MKRVLTLTLLLLVSATINAQEEDNVGWFDMGNCEICQQMAGIQGAMQHIKWEIHQLENGCLSVTVLPDDLKEQWTAAMKGVEESVAQLEQGKEMKLCGYCQSMSALMVAGAKKQSLETVAGHVDLITSDDPAIVKKIHAHVSRTLEETKKMAELMEHSHDDHSHDDHSHDGDHEHSHDSDHDHDEDHDHDGVN